MMRRASLIKTAALLALAGGCREAPQPGESRGSTTPRYERAEGDASALEQATRRVRIGELGPSFAACNALATTRNRSAEEGQTLAVRAAPYEAAHETDRLPAEATFFICSRSLDQKWFGLVYDQGGVVADHCGVSRPLPSRRDYKGPCRSGWASSASVRLIAR
jgi:hypothetical protein